MVFGVCGWLSLGVVLCGLWKGLIHNRLAELKY
jgi:hypothetical protein